MMKQTFKVVRERVCKAYPLENYTLGKMYLDNVYFCETLEDEDRFLENGKTEKIYGRTAIPRGKYRLINSFSNRFQKVLPLVVGVPGYQGIRIHGANDAEDLLGCIGVGKVRTSTGIAQCANSVKRIIEQIDSGEELGIETWIEVE